MKNKKFNSSKITPLLLLMSIIILCICAGVVLFAPELKRKLILGIHLQQYRFKKTFRPQQEIPDPSTKYLHLECQPPVTPTPFPNIPSRMSSEFQKLVASGLTPDKAERELCSTYLNIQDFYFCKTVFESKEKFAFFNKEYAMDNTSVYIARRSGGGNIGFLKIPFVDLDTFEYLGYDYFKDKNGFYYDDDEGEGSYPTKIIQNVDAETVEVIDYKFVKDKYAVFYDSPFSYEAEFISLQQLEEADPATFCKASTDTYFDKSNVYTTAHGIFKVIPRH